MKGKRVLVTGSGTGIGREVALEFARQGAAVALHYSHSGDGARSAVAEICAMGGKAQAFAADFADVSQVRNFGHAALEFLGGLDVLINNAGITLNMPFEKVTPEQFDTLYHVNVRAQFFLTQAVLGALLASHGTIINLSSIHGLAGCPGHAVYAGTKGAVIAYTRELAIELAPRGVRVNTIAPGAVPVESHRKVGAVDDGATGRGIPVGFAGTPLDVARLAVFLCSEDAGYIVGQTIVADGGTTSLMSLISDFRNPSTARFGTGYLPGV
jgi:NAD(P)-dependent dehydrogenase (short-subunit alcohol dehydrogenase family)